MDALLSKVHKKRSSVGSPRKNLPKPSEIVVLSDSDDEMKGNQSFIVSPSRSPIKHNKSIQKKETTPQSLEDISELSDILNEMSESKDEEDFDFDIDILESNAETEILFSDCDNILTSISPRKKRSSFNRKEEPALKSRKITHPSSPSQNESTLIKKESKSDIKVKAETPKNSFGRRPNSIISEEEEDKCDKLKKLAQTHSQWNIPPNCLEVTDTSILLELESMLFPSDFGPSALHLERKKQNIQYSKVCTMAILYRYDCTSFRNSNIAVSLIYLTET